jgi:hypothetical protein
MSFDRFFVSIARLAAYWRRFTLLIDNVYDMFTLFLFDYFLHYRCKA